jgi:hypothetical protein
LLLKAKELSVLAGVEVFLVIQDRKKIKSFQTSKIGQHFNDTLRGLADTSLSDDSDDETSESDEGLSLVKTESKGIQCDLAINKNFKLSIPAYVDTKENNKKITKKN